jgi:hypothetical protein
MFVYEMGIVDFFNGMMPLSDYIKFCEENSTFNENSFSNNHKYMSIIDLKRFLIESFIAVKTHYHLWDGDIREIAISAIPRPTANTPFKILVFKQNNDGISYMVSECPMTSCYAKNEIPQPSALDKFDTKELMEFFTESFNLTEDLFSEALAITPPKPKDNMFKGFFIQPVPPPANVNDSDILKDFQKL